MNVGQVTSKDGTTIVFEQSGEGPALILVGGAFQHRAVDARTAQLAALLAPHFTVFHYDRRGRGDSGNTLPYAVEREIEDLEALIHAAGGSAFVFGMSSGSILALDAAARGLAITKLAVYEPSVLVDDSRPPTPDDYVMRLTELEASGRRGEAVEFFLTKGVGVPAEFVAQMRQAPVWPAFEAVAHTLAYDAALVADIMRGNPLPTQRWEAVTILTLGFAGSASPAWLQHGTQALVDVLPNARHGTLEGQTHDVAPEVLAPVMTAFFLG